MAESDLIAAVPRQLVRRYAARFDLVAAELPLPRQRDAMNVVATKAAMMDAGVLWLLERLVESVAPSLADDDQRRRGRVSRSARSRR